MIVVTDLASLREPSWDTMEPPLYLYWSGASPVALPAAAGHGFALGGGNALLVYGIIVRPSQDVELCTGQVYVVAAAASLGLWSYTHLIDMATGA